MGARRRMTAKKPPPPDIASILATRAAELAAQRPSGMLPTDEAAFTQAAIERDDLTLRRKIRDRDQQAAPPAPPAGEKKRKKKRAKEAPRTPTEKQDGHRDWHMMRAEYVYGVIDERGTRSFPSIEALAVKYGVAPGTARSYSHRNDWMGARRIFAEEMAAAADKRAKEMLTTLAAEFEAKVASVANAAVVKAAMFLRGDLKAGEYAAVMGGLRQAVSIARVSMGTPDQITSQQVTVTEGNGHGGGSGIDPKILAAAIADANRRLYQVEADAKAHVPAPTRADD